MIKNIIVMCLLFSFSVEADDLTSTYLKLNCLGRGMVEIIFHRYYHIEERWSGGFEVGSGHIVTKNIELSRFQNNDVLLHLLKDDTYYFHYAKYGVRASCNLIERRTVNVVDLPYHHENKKDNQ
ncbi:hypothetical protein ACGGX0_003538 [Salmonella enterica]|nr:hypothetical protein [Salmonella enterica]EKS4548355.1 hypothetical protein [Salmonella enterica]EKS4590789.1 hypothetical protein [Salmonella enterica]EKS4835211.1 hypothetical protein [Salmonella enterica]EKS4853615.1 hypothetical protein [Salmonella enterica]